MLCCSACSWSVLCSGPRAAVDDTPLLGITPQFAPDPGFFGQVRRVAGTLVHLTTGITLQLKPPIVKPGPFAITFLGPQAIGGVVPNRAYGIAPEVGLFNVLGAPFSASHRSEIAKANQLDQSAQDLQFQLREKEMVAGLSNQQLIDRADVVRINALRGFHPAQIALPVLEAEIARRGITPDQRAARGNYTGDPTPLKPGIVNLTGRNIERNSPLFNPAPLPAALPPAAPIPVTPAIPIPAPGAAPPLPFGSVVNVPTPTSAGSFLNVVATSARAAPESFEPVNGKAIANVARATGIRKQLATERDDP